MPSSFPTGPRRSVRSVPHGVERFLATKSTRMASTAFQSTKLPWHDATPCRRAPNRARPATDVPSCHDVSLSSSPQSRSVVSPPPALAQINSPPPAGFAHVWSIPGALHYAGLATFVACTNGATANATVGVQVFGPTGTSLNDPTATQIVTAPGATVLFGTSNAAALAVDSNLATGQFSKGSARVLASTSKGILCSAWLADVGGIPPISTTSLTIVKKTAQKGD